MSKTTFEIGNKYLIRAVTNYFVGKLVEVTDQFIILENASWVADTGRFSECLKNGTFQEVEPYQDKVGVAIGSIVDFTKWGHDLPTEAQ